MVSASAFVSGRISIDESLRNTELVRPEPEAQSGTVQGTALPKSFSTDDEHHSKTTPNPTGQVPIEKNGDQDGKLQV